MLLDRAEERAAIDEAIEAVRSGHSRALVFVGEAGMGKTSLLRHAVDSASEFDTIWIAGIEAESDLAFAALDRLLRPMMPRVDTQLERPLATGSSHPTAGSSLTTLRSTAQRGTSS